MTKVRSFRLSETNEIKLKDLQKTMKLDNPNKTLNNIIENFYKYQENDRKITLIEQIIKEFA